MEHYESIQYAIYQVMIRVAESEMSQLPCNKGELVDIAQICLDHKSPTGSHMLVDCMVAMQYLSVHRDGLNNVYRLTEYGTRLLSNMADFWRAKGL